MQIEDITAIQSKPFADVLAYIGFVFAPKKVLYFGLNDEKAIQTFLRWNRTDEGGIIESEDIVTKRVGDAFVDVPVKQKEYERKLVGPSRCTDFYAVCETDLERERAKALTQIEEAKDMQVHLVHSDFDTEVRRKVLGEGVDPSVAPDWEELELDAIVVDMSSYQGDLSKIFFGINQMFSGIYVLHGIQKNADRFFAQVAQYAGNSIVVVSPSGDGTAVLIREDLALP